MPTPCRLPHEHTGRGFMVLCCHCPGHSRGRKPAQANASAPVQSGQQSGVKPGGRTAAMAALRGCSSTGAGGGDFRSLGRIILPVVICNGKCSGFIEASGLDWRQRRGMPAALRLGPRPRDDSVIAGAVTENGPRDHDVATCPTKARVLILAENFDWSSTEIVDFDQGHAGTGNRGVGVDVGVNVGVDVGVGVGVGGPQITGTIMMLSIRTPGTPGATPLLSVPKRYSSWMF